MKGVTRGHTPAIPGRALGTGGKGAGIGNLMYRIVLMISELGIN